MLSQERSPERPVTAPTAQSGLPRFGALVSVACAVNASVLAWALLTIHLSAALGIVSGLVVGLAVYGSLYLFVGRGLNPFVQGLRGQAKPATGGPTAVFAALLPLKYLAIGGLMYLLIRGGHLSLFWFVVGFLITQVSITGAVVAHMARHPRR